MLCDVSLCTIETTDLSAISAVAYRPALLAQGLGYNGGNLEEQGMTPPG
ncbi:MAG: hypothetical protein JO114_09330 [Planctomycetaceae bacterium]|nr:hypothetical protein [Planctomycetaceae bacterium]MBV8312029.1 hypothetical protein [Planctomycetaceae bacterium]